MALRRMTFGILAFGIMTLDTVAFCKMTFGIMAFGKMTLLQNDTA
jgi:hypothetical protein